MKIVRIIARLNVGGPARHVVWLTRALQGDGFQSALITGRVPAGEEDMSWFAAAHGVEPVFIEQMSRELSPKDVVSLWKIYREICRQKPDVIHTHTAKAGTVGRLAAFFYRLLKRRSVKIVHTFHGHVFHSYYGNFKTKIFLLIEKALARFATDKIVVITSQQFDEIHNRFGVGRAAQFEIVPLGIDLAPFDAPESRRDILRGEIGASDEKLVIGFVGRLTEIKNIDLLISAIGKIISEKIISFPAFSCVIIGDGHLRGQLERQAAESGLSDSILFLGNRDDADVFYAGLDIVALTSLNEGTPLSLIEAMASGRAIISTAVGGVPDLLGAVETEFEGFDLCERGIAVRTRSAEDFARGLEYLMRDEDLRKSLGERGNEFVRARYGKERLVADIKKLYLDLTSVPPK